MSQGKLTFFADNEITCHLNKGYIKNIFSNLSVGTKVVLLNFILVLFIPFLAHFFFSNILNSIYISNALTFNFFFEILICYAVYIFLAKKQINIRLPSITITERLKGFVNYYNRYKLYVAIFFLIFSIFYFSFNFGYYRYSKLHILDNDWHLIIFSGIVISTLIELDLFYNIIYKGFKKNNSLCTFSFKNFYYSLILICANFLFSNGTAQILKNNIFSFLLIFNFLNVGKVFFKDSIFCSYPRLIKVTISVIIFLLFNWFAGEIFKIKSACNGVKLNMAINLSLTQSGSGIRSLSVEKNKNGAVISKETPVGKERKSVLSTILKRSKELFFYALERLSPNYYSLLYTSSLNLEKRLELSYLSSRSILSGLSYRLNAITGNFFNAERPKVPSICRLNYINITKSNFILNKSGTSPGILGSFGYIMPFPLSSIFCGIYLFLFATLINNLFTNKQINVLGISIIYLYSKNFFDSPLDLLLIFDSSFINVLGIIIISTFFISSKKQCNNRLNLSYYEN